MSDYRRFGALVLIMSVVVLAVGGVAIRVLYDTAFEQQRVSLAQTAVSRVQLIEAVLLREKSESPFEDPIPATIQWISDTHDEVLDFGRIGEFWLGRLEADQIVLLMRHEHLGADKPDQVRIDYPLGEPMRRALAGKSGTIIGLDYRGVLVLAAHEPVPGTPLGVVASFEMADIRAPFVRAAMVVAGVAIVLIGLGAALFLRITNPLIRRLAASKRDLEVRVTERTRDLEAARAKFSATLIQAGEAIITIDEHLDIQLFNDAAEDLFGFKAEEALGKNLEFLLPPPLRDAHKRHVQAFLRSSDLHRRMNVPGEISGLRKDGSEFPAEATISCFMSNGAKLGTVMLRDISERKRQEHQLRAAMEEAQIANRAKTDFLANTSHELRTPLNAIIGFSEVLVSGISGSFTRKQTEYLSDIHQSGLHLLNVINDILDLSKIDAGAIEVSDTQVNLWDAVRTSSRLVAERAHLAHVELENAVPKSIPMIRADARMTKQMIINLLSNAVKFTGAGGRVCVSAQMGGDSALSISVADTGIGMRPQDIPVALAKFGQIDSGLNRRNTGTGLGLPLVAEHIRLHGGTMEIISQPAGGTTVTIQFPPDRTILNEGGAHAAE